MIHESNQTLAELTRAQEEAFALFEAIEAAAIVTPGRTEHEIERDIYALARNSFGVKRHWHGRIVRAGANTVASGKDLPVRTVGEDDIVYVDLGPVFGKWEADVGKSYAFGDDPEKHRLCRDLPIVFDAIKAHYKADPSITGADLYAYACTFAESRGWRFGGAIAGHVVGEFMHTRVAGEWRFFGIGPENTRPMNAPDDAGKTQYWIIEVNLASQDNSFGGFYERLMETDDMPAES